MFDLDRPSLPFKSARLEATLAYSGIYRMFSESHCYFPDCSLDLSRGFCVTLEGIVSR